VQETNVLPYSKSAPALWHSEVSLVPVVLVDLAEKLPVDDLDCFHDRFHDYLAKQHAALPRDDAAVVLPVVVPAVAVLAAVPYFVAAAAGDALLVVLLAVPVAVPVAASSVVANAEAD
jgi:hypothetical protein